MNVPIAIALCAASVLVLPESRIAHPDGRLNPRSALSITGGLVMGLYAVNHGVVDGWSTTGTLASAAAAGVLLTAFFASERRNRSPLVPRSLLRNGSVVRANLAAAAGFGSWLSFVFR